MGLFSEAGLTGYVEKNKIGPLYHTTYKSELKALRNLKGYMYNLRTEETFSRKSGNYKIKLAT